MQVKLQSLQIESGRIGVYRQKIRELKLTDKIEQNVVLQIESRRTASLQIESVRTRVCRQKVEELEYKVGELEFTDRKQENWTLLIERRIELDSTDRKYENWVLHIKSVRTRVYRQKVGDLEFTASKLRTGVYRQKVGEQELTDKKKEITIDFTDKKQDWSLQVESGRTGVCKLIFFEQIRNRN